MTLADTFRRERDGPILAVSDNGDLGAPSVHIGHPGRSTDPDLPAHPVRLAERGQAATPVAECPQRIVQPGVPPESVRFTGVDTLAVPIADQPTTVVHFDPDTRPRSNRRDLPNPERSLNLGLARTAGSQRLD